MLSLFAIIRKEYNHIRLFDSNATIYYNKNNFVEYLRFYSRAKFGILNRVHGAFAMASFGRPSIVIGNDSRAKDD